MSGVEGAEREDYDEREAGVERASGCDDFNVPAKEKSPLLAKRPEVGHL
jgi:hypothetical protein